MRTLNFIVHLTPNPSPIGEGSELLTGYLLFLFFYNLFLYISNNFYLFLFFTVHCSKSFIVSSLGFVVIRLSFIVIQLFFTKYEFYECTNIILFTVQKSFEFIISGLWSYSCHSIVIQLFIVHC